MKLPLTQIRKWLDADSPVTEGAVATGYSIDSRTVGVGDLFFAIRGPNSDGHAYVEQALGAGAVGAVVEARHPGGNGRDLIRVDDPAEALRRLAASARRHWNGSVVGITGSNGKTTTKEATAALLSGAMAVSKTEGNLNNELGLPLSILRTGDNDRVAVLEMGMNHAGEIRTLAQIAQPYVGVVTNVSAAHVGFFDSVDGVAAAKRELIESLDQSGTAVLNADDSRVAKFAAAHSGRTISFGIDCEADVRATDVVDLGADGLRFRVDGHEFETALAGRHNAYNVLAALAVARSFGLTIGSMVESVRRLRAVGMRGEIRRIGGVTIIDDCYNANPAAMAAMLDLLRNTPARRRIAVLGEMRELGTQSKALHRMLGEKVREAGVDRLLAVAGDAVEIARTAGVPSQFCDEPQAAGRALSGSIEAGDAVLLKGSRGVALERARDLLLQALESADALVEEVS